jgi:hypothetical protein
VAPLLPPKSPNGLDLTQRAVYTGGPAAMADDIEECIPKKHTDLFNMPLGLKGFYDLEEGLACARKGPGSSRCKPGSRPWVEQTEPPDLPPINLLTINAAAGSF